ncbi:hypothetical protein [Ferruginibacter sp.]|uniref:hypothetical protein n=1 Tax=Ferruginibacter sp. TaxID=1940288 RepID=UPI00265A7AAC|nr:hypothetical protein [Ferruginibacter sp.]
MGLTDSLFKRKLPMDYLFQTSQLMGSFYYNRSLQQMPVIDEYENKGKLICAVWVADEKGTTIPCSLSFPADDSVIVYRRLAAATFYKLKQ